MKNEIFKMINKKLEIGDTVSVYNNDNLLIRGIVYIYGSIPLDKFYNKVFLDTKQEYYSMSNDVYEDALVIIDDKNADKLFVLTLENDDYKYFVWNDLIYNDKNFKFERVANLNNLKIVSDNATLTEISYSFK